MNVFTFSKRSALRRCKAFTLVETVVALGIVAFAMLGVLGMVPLGLSNFREAMSTTAEAQIIQGISNDIRLTAYAELLDEYREKTNTFYYNDEGRLVEESTQAKAFEVTVNSVDLIPPVASGGSTNSAQVLGQTFRVEVRKLGSSQPARKYFFLVSKG